MTTAILNRSIITPEQRFGLERLLSPTELHQSISNCRRYADNLLPADAAQMLVRRVMAAPHPDGLAFNVEWGGKAVVSYVERSRKFLGRFLQGYLELLEPIYLDANGLDGVIDGARAVHGRLKADVAAGTSDSGFRRNKEIVDYMQGHMLGSEAERAVLRAVKFVFGTYRESLLVGHLDVKAKRLEALRDLGKHLATTYLLQSRPDSDFEQDSRPIDMQKLLAADPVEMANYAIRDMKAYRSVINGLEVRRSPAVHVVETPVIQTEPQIVAPQDEAYKGVLAAITASKNGFHLTESTWHMIRESVAYVVSKVGPQKANQLRRALHRVRLCDVSPQKPTEAQIGAFLTKIKDKADQGSVPGPASLVWDYDAALKGQ